MYFTALCYKSVAACSEGVNFGDKIYQFFETKPVPSLSTIGFFFNLAKIRRSFSPRNDKFKKLEKISILLKIFKIIYLNYHPFLSNNVAKMSFDRTLIQNLEYF